MHIASTFLNASKHKQRNSNSHNSTLHLSSSIPAHKANPAQQRALRSRRKRPQRGPTRSARHVRAVNSTPHLDECARAHQQRKHGGARHQDLCGAAPRPDVPAERLEERRRGRVEGCGGHVGGRGRRRGEQERGCGPPERREGCGQQDGRRGVCALHRREAGDVRG